MIIPVYMYSSPGGDGVCVDGVSVSTGAVMSRVKASGGSVSHALGLVQR